MRRQAETRPKNPLVAKIDELRLELPGAPSRNMLAIIAGLDRNILRQVERRGPAASLAPRAINSLAKALNTDAGVLLAAAPKSSPKEPPIALPRSRDMIDIVGHAIGGLLDTVAFREPIDRVDRPPGLEHVPDAYAVYVTGASMIPMHPPGELRFVHPHKPVRPGDSVVVQTYANVTKDIQGWIKIFVKETEHFLICKQLNPPGEVRFSLDAVKQYDRILTTAELFNK